ncbi:MULTISPECIES: hypothetical protein [unclassified Streptomyces]|uniref:hypothetical protein n=1 Tax=unclassified Streptomyces TaxID=2593676 RepID=UPI002DDC837C|nr:hypothetical protein [Streptomyces sp. NBC_01445]WSE03124.1 hypothetical protein OG574_06800 [Streptomyces sp. NBC_01445]
MTAPLARALDGARTTVCAVLMVIDNAVRTRSLDERPNLADHLTELGTGLLLGQE